MLSRKSISREQLTTAIEAQRANGRGRIGEWLIETSGISEVVITSALAAQWGVPVLALGARRDARIAQLLPRFLVELSGVVPLRVAGGRILYVAVDEHVDRCVNQAIEAMTGYRVEAGVMKPSEYALLRRSKLDEPDSGTRIFGPASVDRMLECITDLIAANGATSARLVRFRGYIWVHMEHVAAQPEGRLLSQALRPVMAPQIEDAIFTISGPS